jgi:hypothetical protein
MTRADLLPALAALAVAAACGGGAKKEASGRTITVTGRLPAAPPAQAAAVASLADARKLVIASADGGVEVVAVTNGAFSFHAGAGAPLGVVFAGPGDVYLGYLAVRNLASLPLHAADPELTTLDLGTLIASGTAVAPGIDPIGRGITLGDTELRALAALDQGFRSMVAHPDADGDGVLDWLQGREYRTQLLVAFSRGTIPALTGVVPEPNAIDGWNFGVQIDERLQSYPPYVTMQGPAGSGISGSSQLGRLFSQGDHQSVYYAAFGAITSGFPVAGTYTVGYSGRTLTFDVPDATGLYGEVPEPVPTVTLNPDFTIREVAWVYRLADGSTVAAPPALVQNVQVQVETRQGTAAVPCAGVNGTRAYEVILPGADTAHVLGCQKIAWGNVFQLFLGYTDVFGNNVLTGWVP